MAEPVTNNKQFTIPNTGDLVNAWGPALNNNFAEIDALLGSTKSLTIASGSYTLTTTDTQNARISLAGTLTGNVTIVVPQYAAYFIFHDNTTRGGYTITVQTGATGQRTQNLPARLSHVFTDGAGVYLVNEPLIGSAKPHCGSSAPPLWQLCYGQAISRTTYADLFTEIGTTWGGGDGSTTFNLPDFRGRTVFGLDNMGGSAAGRVTTASGINGTTLGAAGGHQLLQSHNHTASDSGHGHSDSGHGHSDAGHGHTTPAGYNYDNNSQAPNVATTGINSGTQPISTGYANIQTGYAAITTGYANISVGSTGSGNAQNMPPTAMANWIIYCGQ